ncbi:MAG: PQQ-like beta-propeller repeat protein [Planctomycetes bacterium]|nr:PQQ-like beta-propeller repeat protein [Planctomycetota bacterium]
MLRFGWMLLISTVCVATAQSADWPQWRGPARDGHSADTGLLQTWPEAGPALRWKAADIGTGYSAPSIVKGRVYLQTTRGNEECLLILDEKTGAKIVETPIGKVGVNRGPQYPGSRATPTVDGERVYCLASDGELVCLESSSGAVKWRKHLREDFGGVFGNWAYTESVLVDGDAVICTPGGEDAALVALNKLTGATLWKSSIPDGGTAEYASIMIAQAAGAKEYVTFLRNGLVGVDAKTGKLLWMYNKTIDPGANILTPIVAGDRIFSSGSRTGGGVVQLKPAGDGVTAEPLYFDTKVAPSIGGAVLVDGNIYGTTQQSMFCADFATGTIHWTDRSVGPASICFADKRLYVRGYNSGEVALVEPSSAGYKEISRFKQADRSKIQAWPHPVVANGGLYLRDQDVLLSYEVQAK